jgi:hypothetical protein
MQKQTSYTDPAIGESLTLAGNRSEAEMKAELAKRRKASKSAPEVASGIALHAAMGDGMAPLSLPEIAAYDISAARRAALVADLPAGVLKWSGPSLENELCEFLKRGTDRDVWLAVVELMSRSGSTAWTGSLEDAIINAQARGNWMDERFWARMILIVPRMIRNTPQVSEQLRRPLENLVGECYKELPARRGLKAMVDTTYQSNSITSLDS